MFKAFNPSTGMISVLTLTVAALAGCGAEDEGVTWSRPEPRVASFSANLWTVEGREDDRFSTSNSIFARATDGRPVALQNMGGTLNLGRWSGTGWIESEVGKTTAVDDDSQLFSGIMSVDSNGSPHAMFVTLLQSLYYAGQQGDTWKVIPLPESYISCYDLATGSDGMVRMLYANKTSQTTVLAYLDAQGELIEQDLPEAGAACGTLAIGDDGTIGAALWLAGKEEDETGVVKLYERSPDSETWTIEKVATDGYFDLQCGYCNIPELAYRSDGLVETPDVPAILYVTREKSVNFLERMPDSSYQSQVLVQSGEAYQLTRFKQASDGRLGTLVISATSGIHLAVSSADGFSYELIGSGVQVNTPRLVWTSAGAFASYWDIDGLNAILPDGSGGYVTYQVDAEANEGNEVGTFVAVGEDGVPQIFYNEMHQDN